MLNISNLYVSNLSLNAEIYSNIYGNFLSKRFKCQCYATKHTQTLPVCYVSRHLTVTRQ
jgi:hypothetical protein